MGAVQSRMTWVLTMFSLLLLLSCKLSEVQGQSSCGTFVVTAEAQGQVTQLISAATTCDNGVITVKWHGSVQLTSPIVLSEGSELRIEGQGDDAQIDGGTQSRLIVLRQKSTLKLSNIRLTSGSEPLSSSSFSSSRGLAAEISTTSSYTGTSVSGSDSGSGGSTSTVLGGKSSSSGTSTLLLPSSSTATETNSSSAFDTDYSSSSALYYGGVSTQESRGGAIYGSVNTTIVLINCTLEGNSAAVGGALYARGGSEVFVYSSHFNNNTAGTGGAIYAIGSLMVQDSTFAFNEGREFGGALGVASGSRVDVRNTNFTGNTASHMGGGGAIYAYSWPSVQVQYNTSTREVDIKSEGEKAVFLTLARCRFTRNVAVGDSPGGAIWASSGVKLNVTDTLFESNSGSRGGGVTLTVSAALFTNSVFLHNEVADLGGAVALELSSSALFNQCYFEGNYALNEGGGIYANDCDPVELSSTELRANSADQSGGALSLHKVPEVFISNSTFSLNTATFSGASIFLFSSNTVIESSNFSDSTAYSVPAIVMSACQRVYMSAVQMDFSKSAEDVEGNGASSALSVVNSVVNVYGIIFTNWKGDVVVENVIGTLILDEADFTSCTAPLLVSSSSTATTVVRNPVLARSNYASGSDIITNGKACADQPCGVTNATCVDGSSGDRFCSCYKSDLAGIRCISSSEDFLSAGETSTTSMVSLTTSSGEDTSAPLIAYYPDEASTTFVVTAMWDDPARLAIWNASTIIIPSDGGGGGGDDDGLILTVIPSAGILAGGSSASILVTASVPDASVPAVNMKTDANFSLEVLSVDGVIEHLTAPMEVQMWLCEAEKFWNGTQCLSCNDLLQESINGVDCSEPGSTLQTLAIKPRYWRASETSLVIRRCNVGHACIGGSDIEGDRDNYCASGYEGPYCAVCASGYGSSFGGRCHTCGDSSTKAAVYSVVAIFFLIILLIIIAVVLFLFHPVPNPAAAPSKKKTRADKKNRGRFNFRVLVERSEDLSRISSTLKILLVATQIITQYCAIVDVDFVGPYAKMLAVLNIFNFNLAFLVSATCVVETNLYTDLLVVTIVPVVVLSLLAITYCITDWRSAKIHRAATISPSSPSHYVENPLRTDEGCGGGGGGGAGGAGGGGGDGRGGEKGGEGGHAIAPLKSGQTMTSISESYRENNEGEGGAWGVGDAGSKKVLASAIPRRRSSHYLSNEPVGDVVILRAAVDDEIKRTSDGNEMEGKDDGNNKLAINRESLSPSSWHNSERLNDSEIDGCEETTEYEEGQNIIGSRGNDDGIVVQEIDIIDDEASLGQGFLNAMREREMAPALLSWPETRTVIRKRHVAVLIVFLFVMYCTLSTTIFHMLSPCDHLDDEHSYIRADYSLECGTSRYDAMYIYAAFMVFVYPLGIPAVFSYVLWRYRNRLTVEQRLPNGKDCRRQDETLSHVSVLWYNYKPQAYYFELIEFGRRLMLTSLLIFIVPNSAGQEATACLLAFVFAITFEALAPMGDHHETILYRMSAVFVFLVILLSLVAKVDVSEETNYDQKVYETTLVALNVLLIVVFVGQCIYQVYWLSLLGGKMRTKASSARCGYGGGSKIRGSVRRSLNIRRSKILDVHVHEKRRSGKEGGGEEDSGKKAAEGEELRTAGDGDVEVQVEDGVGNYPVVEEEKEVTAPCTRHEAPKNTTATAPTPLT